MPIKTPKIIKTTDSGQMEDNLGVTWNPGREKKVKIRQGKKYIFYYIVNEKKAIVKAKMFPLMFPL